jgi:hypothetical protein
MRTTTFAKAAVIVAASMAMRSTFAIDLNAPGEKKVTVGSEILRGFSAVLELPSERDHAKARTQVAIILSQNRQARMDSDGFLVGYYCGAWLYFGEIRDSLKRQKVDKADEEMQNLQAEAFSASQQYMFALLREAQKQLGVDDASMQKVIDPNGEMTAKIAVYEKTVKLLKTTQ